GRLAGVPLVEPRVAGRSRAVDDPWLSLAGGRRRRSALLDQPLALEPRERGVDRRRPHRGRVDRPAAELLHQRVSVGGTTRDQTEHCVFRGYGHRASITVADVQWIRAYATCVTAVNRTPSASGISDVPRGAD